MRIIYEKVKDGDPISDVELEEGIEFFSDLEEKLKILGPVFHLTWREALDVRMVLEYFQKARNEK